MKNLELNKYGVQEMNASEMRENNGGGGWGDALTIAQLAGSVTELWVRVQSRVLEQLGSDAENAAVQYN